MNMAREHKNEESKAGLELLTTAQRNGLVLNPDRLEINESGMDFLVGFATDAEGRKWVLRKPRRPDVWERAENERTVLTVTAKHLPVQVPDWRIFTPDLIAYPLVSGDPVATVDPEGGGYQWKFPQETLSDAFLDSLAETLAALHNIEHTEAIAAGIRYKKPEEARNAFAANIDEIKQSFDVPRSLYERWMGWLSTDSYWPAHSALNHGDLHPPHILVDAGQRVTGLIDWTEAEIADPGKDFVILYALFGVDWLNDFLRRYEKAEGRTWPRMGEHIAEQWAAYPAQVAKFALITGRESDREMAKGMLANWSAE